MTRVRTITLSPPQRERDGFGCPHCGAPLPTDPTMLRQQALRVLRCCGYQPTPQESRRWAMAGQQLAQKENHR